jgi:hypothetical protein
MNGMNDDQHSEAVESTIEWAKGKLTQHPNDGDTYWLTPEGQEVIAIAECAGLI